MAKLSIKMKMKIKKKKWIFGFYAVVKWPEENWRLNKYCKVAGNSKGKSIFKCLEERPAFLLKILQGSEGLTFIIYLPRVGVLPAHCLGVHPQNIPALTENLSQSSQVRWWEKWVAGWRRTYGVEVVGGDFLSDALTVGGAWMNPRSIPRLRRREESRVRFNVGVDVRHHLQSQD